MQSTLKLIGRDKMLFFSDIANVSEELNGTIQNSTFLVMKKN